MYTIIAELAQDTLKKIYELTYKYGWINYEEDLTGWLPDKAYNEKYKIEGELSPILREGFEEIVQTYDEWLEGHTREGWIANALTKADTTLDFSADDSADALTSIFSMLDYWKIPYQEKLFELVEEGLGGPRAMLESEDDEFLAEQYGSEFLHQYMHTLPKEQLDAISQILLAAEDEDAAASELVLEYDLLDPLKDWVINDLEWSGAEWLSDVYTVPDLISSYSNVLYTHLRELLDFSYDHYLDYFELPAIEGGKSLRENINDVADVKEILEKDQFGTLDERIRTFQLALTTAHHHGSMVEHLLGLRPRTGVEFLDELSAGPHVEEWDEELTKVLGHPPGSIRKEEPMQWFDPAAARLEPLRASVMLQLATTLQIILYN